MAAGACNSSTADCNGNPADGCEADLTQPQTCGSCNHACSLPHVAAPVCNNGVCGVGACVSGFLDCNGDPKDGCETDGTTTGHCGSCGTDCTMLLPHSNVACVAGACVANMCMPGLTHCTTNPHDVCETRIDTTSHCGSCANDCTQLPHVVASSCAGSPLACGITACESAWADCDQLASTGCEADLTRVSTCGACNNDCTQLPHVAASACAGAPLACAITSCASGWADCDKLASSGCEADLTSPSTCGACNHDCTHLSNVAQASCNGGQCGIAACAPGYKSCSGDVTKGCDTDLRQLTTCGDCNVSCVGSVLNVNNITCDGVRCGYDNGCKPGYLDMDHDPTNGCESATPSGVPEAGSLYLWLTADSSFLPGNYWPDQSGQGHNARCPNAPSLVPYPAPNRSARRFDGATNACNIGADSSVLSGGVTLMFVWNPSAQAGNTPLIEFNDTNGGWGPVVGIRSGGTPNDGFLGYYTCHGGGYDTCQNVWMAPGKDQSHAGTWPLGVWTNISVKHALDRSVSFKINGHYDWGGFIDLPSAVPRVENLIGGSSIGLPFFSGDISEVVVFSTALSDASEAAIASYFNLRYGLH
jgi:hypothetical protein